MGFFFVLVSTTFAVLVTTELSVAGESSVLDRLPKSSDVALCKTFAVDDNRLEAN